MENRPNHPDFMTSSELRKAKFSGMRHNSISNEMEIWIDGVMEKAVSIVEMQNDPYVLDKAYKEAFGFKDHAVIERSK